MLLPLVGRTSASFDCASPPTVVDVSVSHSGAAAVDASPAVTPGGFSTSVPVSVSA